MQKYEGPADISKTFLNKHNIYIFTKLSISPMPDWKRVSLVGKGFLQNVLKQNLKKYSSKSFERYSLKWRSYRSNVAPLFQHCQYFSLVDKCHQLVSSFHSFIRLFGMPGGGCVEVLIHIMASTKCSSWSFASEHFKWSLKQSKCAKLKIYHKRLTVLQFLLGSGKHVSTDGITNEMQNDNTNHQFIDPFNCVCVVTWYFAKAEWMRRTSRHMTMVFRLWEPEFRISVITCLTSPFVWFYTVFWRTKIS